MYPIEKYNFVTYDKKNADGTISKTTVAISTYAGKVVKGVAKCIENDEFNTDSGRELSAARCDVKVCAKRKARAEKKYLEACKALESLENYVRMMGNYYSEAKYEYDESKARLESIESKLA